MYIGMTGSLYWYLSGFSGQIVAAILVFTTNRLQVFPFYKEGSEVYQFMCIGRPKYCLPS